MPASCPLYHTINQQIAACAPQLPVAARERLTVLVTGIVGAGSCVQAAVAREVAALQVTGTTRPESVGRRLRRTLNDPHLTADGAGYGALLAALLADAPDPTQPVVLVLDESTKTDQIHLLRLSLSYRGGSVPIAWAIWEQNTPQPVGAYWAAVDQVLAAAALLLDARPVLVLADRAYAVANLIDRLAARGWQWAIRITTTGSHRFWPTGADEVGLATLVAAQLPRPGSRFRCWGRFAKKAGWRTAQLVGLWGRNQAEPLVIVTNCAAAWATLHAYDRRFWIESGFRLDKRKGWQWESCQVRDLAHQTVVLLALAWATVVVFCLGVAQADRELTRLRQRPARRLPRQREHARQSLASRGLAAVRAWLYHPPHEPLAWTLPNQHGPSWNDQWIGAQIHQFLFPSPVRP